MVDNAAEKFPYGTIERDLCVLAARRSSDALYSVMQLSDDPRVKFEIAVSAMGQMIAAASGIYATLHGLELGDGLKKELAIAVIDLALEVKKGGDHG